MAKDSAFIRDIRRALGPEWTLEGMNRSRHLRFRHRDGALMVAGTGGCPRAVKNILATARKLVRSHPGSLGSKPASGC